MKIPLILVHGWAGSSRSWEPLVSRFDAELWDPIIAISLPGSPGSGTVAPARVQDAAESLVSAMRELPAPAVIIGHSMGAQVTLLAHGSAPDATLAEVVIDPAYGPPGDERSALAAWERRISRRGHDELAPFFERALDGVDARQRSDALEDFRRTPLSVILSYLRSEYLDADAIGMLPNTLRAASSRVRPVLAVHSMGAAAATERVLRNPPGSRIELWPGSCHFLHLQHPDRFAGLVDAWGRERALDLTPARRSAAPSEEDAAP